VVVIGDKHVITGVCSLQAAFWHHYRAVRPKCTEEMVGRKTTSPTYRITSSPACSHGLLSTTSSPTCANATSLGKGPHPCELAYSAPPSSTSGPAGLGCCISFITLLVECVLQAITGGGHSQQSTANDACSRALLLSSMCCFSLSMCPNALTVFAPQLPWHRIGQYLPTRDRLSPI